MLTLALMLTLTLALTLTLSLALTLNLTLTLTLTPNLIYNSAPCPGYPGGAAKGVGPGEWH